MISHRGSSLADIVSIAVNPISSGRGSGGFESFEDMVSFDYIIANRALCA